MSKIRKITKRSAASVFRQSSPAANSTAMVNSLNNLSSDIGEILAEHLKVMAILNGLAHGSEDSITGLSSSLDSTVVGLDGSVAFTKRASTTADPEYIFSRTLNRPLTVKESIIEAYNALKESIDSIIIDVPDVISDYTMEYIGEKAFSSSASSSSTSIDGRLTALEAEFDALAIPDLDLDPIKLFIGMDDLDTPQYTTHNAVTYISDGDSLEKAIAILDDAVASIPSYTPPVIPIGGVTFGDGTGALQTDVGGFFWDNAAKRLGLGNSAPQAQLHVTGMIYMTTGLQSYGGNARGANAIDLQTSRSAANQVASAAGSFILGGRNNRVTATYAGAAGDNNLAQGAASFVVGEFNEANSSHSFATGTRARTQFNGAQAQANGQFAQPGDAQRQTIVVRNVTNAIAGATELFIDGVAQSITLNDNSAYVADIKVVGRSATGNTAGYAFRLVVERGAGPGTIAIIGAPLKEILGEDVAGWDANVQVNTGNGSLQIMVDGDVNNNIRWVGTVEFTQTSW